MLGVAIAALGVLGGLWSIYEMWQKWLAWRDRQDKGLDGHLKQLLRNFEYTIRVGSIVDGMFGVAEAELPQRIPTIRNRRLRHDVEMALLHANQLRGVSFPYKPWHQNGPFPEPPVDLTNVIGVEELAVLRREVAAKGKGAAERALVRLEKRGRHIHP